MCASKGGAAAVGALLSVAGSRRGNCRAKRVGISRASAKRSCFQKTVDGMCPSLPKKLLQLKKFDQQRYGTMEVQPEDRELRSGHGHVY